MNKEELLEIFENEELMKSLLDACMQEDFYVTNKKPFYSLEDCLKNTDEKILESIYMSYKHVISAKKKLKSNPSHDEMIKILEIEIKEAFNQFLDTLTKEDKDILEEIAKNKKTDKLNINLLSNGFMFGFKENKKNIYVVPNEIMILYNEYKVSDLKKERDYKTANLYVMAYVLMNGIISKSFLEDVLINYYALCISKEQIEEIASTYTIYKNEYYSLISIKEGEEEILDRLLKEKEKRTFVKLEQYKLDEYIKMFHDMTQKIGKALNTAHKGLIDIIFSKIFLVYQSPEEIIEPLGLTKNESKKITKIIEDYQDSFRYWSLNGRTIEEFERDYFIEKMSLKKKPQKRDLQSCLNAIPKEIYEIIESEYEEEDDLVNQIIQKAKEISQNYNWIELNAIICSNDQELTEMIATNHLKCGIVFLYEENKKIKCLIPTEILENLEKSTEELDENYEEDLVGTYINMNGVIENKKLQELLYEYDDIDVTIEELDNIVINCGAFIIDNKYYTWISDYTKEDAVKMMEIKSKFPKYKEADLELDDYEADFKDELTDLLAHEIPFVSRLDDVYCAIVTIIKYASFDEENIDYIFSKFKISLKEKQKKKILDLYKEYKKYISIWIYNGYTVDEYNKMNLRVSNKVGRNEPCPCRSGKKYKQCCGK